MSTRTIPPKLKKQVWEKYTKIPNATENPCYVCNDTITVWEFECGHVKAFINGGLTTVNNLRPICSSCNRSMGKKDLYTYKKEYYDNHCIKQVAEENASISMPKSRKNIKKSVSEKPFLTNFFKIASIILHLSTSSNKCQYVYKKGKKKNTVCNKMNCNLH